MDSRHAPQVIEEVNWGLYVWETPDGRWVADEDYNVLNISSQKGDIRRIQILADAARACGIEDGSAVFLAGHRQIDDEEFEIQRQRLRFGLVPDEQDVGVLLDEINGG